MIDRRYLAKTIECILRRERERERERDGIFNLARAKVRCQNEAIPVRDGGGWHDRSSD